MIGHFVVLIGIHKDLVEVTLTQCAVMKLLNQYVLLLAFMVTEVSCFQ